MGFNNNYNTKVGFKESLHLACFIADAPADGYCSKREHKLPSSVLFRDKTAYVLYPRKDRKYFSSNMLGGGSYKEVYPALKIKIKSRKVFLAVQIVPNDHDCLFEKNVLERMRRFSALGRGFPRIFLDTTFCSEKKQNATRELVVQPLWKARSLKSHTLQARIKAGKPGLPLSVMINVACCLSLAIRKTHRQGLYHGDVKPDNCLYDGESKACLTDFDLSRKKGNAGWWSKMFYGTAPYIPPEQLESCYMEEGSGQPADMYVFGLLFHELAIGKAAWFDCLVRHYNSSHDEIMIHRKKCLAYRMKYENYVKEVVSYLSSQDSRKRSIALQKEMLVPLENLEANPHKNLEQSFNLMIYKLLHPDPALRLTADQFYEESRILRKEDRKRQGMQDHLFI